MGCRVGIGTDVPVEVLNVIGNINATDICLADGTCLSTLVSGASTADNALFIYDANGVQDPGTAYTNLTFDTVVRADSAYTYSADAVEVEINNNGWYDITYECTTESTHASTRFHTDFRIALNGAILPGGFGATYNRITADGNGSVSINSIAVLTVGDKLNFQAQTDDTGSSVLTVDDACRVKILLMDNNGGINGTFWNQTGDDVWYTQGSVGIGTQSPTHPLNVIGNTNITGNLSLGGIAGTTILKFAPGPAISFQRIIVDTLDGADNNLLCLSGGGKCADADRGAYINLIGNEFDFLASEGNINIVAGDTSLGGIIQITTGGVAAIIIDHDGDIHFGTTSSSRTYEFEDGSVCIGNGGCAAASTDGRLTVEGSIVSGRTGALAYNAMGTGTTDDGLANANDLYITDDLEVDGTFYLTGGSGAIVNSDVAENLLTINGREAVLCEGDVNCIVENFEKELDYGDVVCIDIRHGQTITKCTQANSHLVAGVVSNTSVLNMGNNGMYANPIGVAGIVWVTVNLQGGDIHPGDLLVTSYSPGQAMANPIPRQGTILGKAYDFCTEKEANDKGECDILMFIALG